MSERTVLIAFAGALISVGLWGRSALADPAYEAAAKSKLKPLNIFEGRVVDAADGRPVAGARVAAADAELGFIRFGGTGNVYAYGPDETVLLFFTRRNGRRSGTARTDDAGRFVIKGLKSGSYSVFVSHPEKGFALQGDVNQPNKGEPLDLMLERPAFIEGFIRGLDVDQRRLMLQGKTDVSNVMLSPDLHLRHKGAFRVGPLPAATWQVSAQQFVMKQGYSATLLNAAVDVMPGKTARLDVDLTSGSAFDGVVRGPKDEPLSGVSVVATTVAMPSLAIGAVTDRHGKYTLRGLPAGEYSLDAKRWAIRTAPG